MNQITKRHYISSLILKERLGLLNEAEKEELEIWVNDHSGHRDFYDFLRQKDFATDLDRYDFIDEEKGWQKCRKQNCITRPVRIYRWISVAAMLVILMGITIYWYQSSPNIQQEMVAINPGSPKALLILSDGSVRRLEASPQEKQITMGELVIRNAGTMVQYASKLNSLSRVEENNPVYNELQIPVGGEYQLVLADGTKVWLNSQSSLKYPVVFHGHTREVELEGEAYFEVAHDSGHPFLVRLKNELVVEVLGTSFNVRDYGDESEIQTVLEQGAVKVFRGKEEVILSPGMMGVYNRDKGNIHLETVETELYTAWRDGQYVFQAETVENILHKLSRWYGMHVFYQNEEVKNLIFSGSIRKYETIQNLLNAMERSGGVRFEVKGNTVVVSEAR